MDNLGDLDAGYFRPSAAEQADIEAAGEHVRYLLGAFERGILTEDDLVTAFQDLPASTLPDESELAFTWQNGPLAVVQQEETAGRLPMRVATRIVQALLLSEGAAEQQRGDEPQQDEPQHDR